VYHAMTLATEHWQCYILKSALHLAAPLAGQKFSRLWWKYWWCGCLE
jgi:hypothetical protein